MSHTKRSGIESGQNQKQGPCLPVQTWYGQHRRLIPTEPVIIITFSVIMPYLQ